MFDLAISLILLVEQLSAHVLISLFGARLSSVCTRVVDMLMLPIRTTTVREHK